MTTESVQAGLNQVSDALIQHTKDVFTRQESNYNFIFGRRGKGKTAWALLIAQILKMLIPNLIIATNIKIFSSYFDIEFISDLQSLHKWCEAYKDSPKLMILDEVGRIAKKRRFMSSINVKLIEDLQVLRKYNLNLIYITQSEKVVDSQLIDGDYLDGFYDRWVIDILEYTDIYGSHRLDHTFDTKIQMTDINYDSHDVARFTEFPEATSESRKAFFGEDKDLVEKWYRNKMKQSNQPLDPSERSRIRQIKEKILIEKWVNYQSASVLPRSCEDNPVKPSTKE